MFLSGALIIQLLILFSANAAENAPTTPFRASTEEPSSIITTTTPKPINKCPNGWIYAGRIGCFYLNTNSNKVYKFISKYTFSLLN